MVVKSKKGHHSDFKDLRERLESHNGEECKDKIYMCGTCVIFIPSGECLYKVTQYDVDSLDDEFSPADPQRYMDADKDDEYDIVVQTMCGDDFRGLSSGKYVHFDYDGHDCVVDNIKLLEYVKIDLDPTSWLDSGLNETFSQIMTSRAA